nr:TIGR03936 family radical SAM-associated protein [Phytoactinopolyspora mesophila]
MRVRFAKRGRLRFTSHRDFQRAFERALRRAQVPMAFSYGFTPHPKISFAGAAPTGAASEAEYLEISLTDRRDPDQIRLSLDEALPPGLDIIEVGEVDPAEPGSLADRLRASLWEIACPGAAPDEIRSALATFLGAESVEVERLTKKGNRKIDARGAVLFAEADESHDTSEPAIRCVIEHQTPTVRPEEVLAGLRVAAGFTPPSPPRARRLAQGTWDEQRRELIPLTLSNPPQRR